MRKLLEIAKAVNATSPNATITLLDPRPDIATLARQLADAMPGCWSAGGEDRIDGWVTANITLSNQPYESVGVAIFGVRRPVGWVNPGHQARWTAEKAAGDLVLSVCAAEDEASIVITEIDDHTERTIAVGAVS